MKAIAKNKPTEPKVMRCPVCARYHAEHPEFGPFCCASCLQVIIRPLIVTLTAGQLR